MKKILNVLVLLVGLPLLSMAQTADEHFKDSRFSIGFALEVYQNNHRITTTDINKYQLSTAGGLGFGIGNTAIYKITDQRLMVKGEVLVKFASDKYVFSGIQQAESELRWDASDIMLSLHPMIRLWEKARLYLVVGPSLAYDLGDKNKQRSEYLEFKKLNPSFELGISRLWHFRQFNLAPELRYSFGLRNRHLTQQNQFSESIQNIYQNRVSLYFGFF